MSAEEVPAFRFIPLAEDPSGCPGLPGPRRHTLSTGIFPVRETRAR